MDLGEHNITINYAGDSNNAPTIKSEHITVLNAVEQIVQNKTSDLVITLDKKSVVYGDGNFTATLSLSSEGKPISGPVNFSVNGDERIINVLNGKATV